MTVPVFITLVLGILAIMSTLIGFGFKIGSESQRNKHLAATVAELKRSVRILHRRMDRLGVPSLDDDSSPPS